MVARKHLVSRAKPSSQPEGVPRGIWRKPAPRACAERVLNKGGPRTPAPGTAVRVRSPPVNGLALSPRTGQDLRDVGTPRCAKQTKIPALMELVGGGLGGETTK